jgi:hypothetical protein
MSDSHDPQQSDPFGASSPKPKGPLGSAAFVLLLGVAGVVIWQLVASWMGGPGPC